MVPRIGRVLWRRGVVLLIVAGALVAGCANVSGYQYLSHRQSTGSDLYFKLPNHWKVFTQQQVIEQANGPISKSQLKQIEGEGWLVTFVGTPHGTVGESNVINGSHPTGIVEAMRLSPSSQDSISFATLRTELLSNDPLNPPSPDPYEVLNYSTFTRPGGLWGNKMEVDIKGSNGAVATFNQVAMVDLKNSWLYLIAVSCKATCYAANQSLINQVLKSWNVKE